MRRLQHVSFALTVFLGLATASLAAPRTTLIIAADLWCPINCAPDAANRGIGVDLAERVFAPVYQVRYVTMPWARALEEVRAGRIDAVIGANSNDDPSLLYPRNPISRITDDFYVRADNPLAYRGLRSLRGKRVGIIKDYGYDPALRRMLDTSAQVEGTGGDDPLEQNIRKLLAGHLDVVVESGVIMQYKLKQLGLEKEIRHLGGIEQGHVYLAFSPALAQSRGRIRQYDAGIARLRASGALRTIYATYGLKP